MCLVFQVEQDSSVNDANPHIANIGRMVEVSTVRLITSLSLCTYSWLFYQVVIYTDCFLLCLSFLKDMENKMRNTLNDIYFGKTRDIVNALRWVVHVFFSNLGWKDGVWPVNGCEKLFPEFFQAFISQLITTAIIICLHIFPCS